MYRILLILLIAFSACSIPETHEAPQNITDQYVTPNVSVQNWATGLEVPWSLVFINETHALVSERPGTITLIINGIPQEEPYYVFDAQARGEGGLMGLAHTEQYTYAMLTTETDNRVVRLRHQGTTASFDVNILTDIPKARVHNGGRIAIGPDNKLYIATGDTWEASLAQDTNSLAGKILRLNLDGTIPEDNPFNNAVWSYGHRNPQGIAWHEDGTLYISEHGPSGDGGAFAHDEINIIKKGANYGWPEVIGAPQDSPYENPIVVWKDQAVPPAGIAFIDDTLYVATLGSRALIVIRLEDHTPISIERWFTEEYGRLRDAVVGLDGALYVATSNRDGRGDPRPQDDKILRISVA